MGRGAKIVIGLVLLVLGAFCLNYTNGFGIAHHTEWANAKGFPAPSIEIFYGGVAGCAIGGILLGHGLGRRSAK